MKIHAVNHIQVNVSLAELPAAREFYLSFLGMKEIPRPAVFKSEGFWFHAGDREMHIGGKKKSIRRANAGSRPLTKSMTCARAEEDRGSAAADQ